MISLIEDKRAIPVSWQIISKRGCSNLAEQKALIRPVIQLFKGYQLLLLGDREFHSIKLANWLHAKKVSFVLRQKQGTYIRQDNQPYRQLKTLGLRPGISYFYQELNVTKQKGFGRFNMAGYYPRKYRGKVEPSGWHLLTNLSSLDATIIAFKRRSGIEAMFKDCKTGGTALGGFADLKQVPCGYNLESTHTSEQRLLALILLIAIAYSCAVSSGRQVRQMRLQKYVGKVTRIKTLSSTA